MTHWGQSYNCPTGCKTILNDIEIHCWSIHLNIFAFRGVLVELTPIPLWGIGRDENNGFQTQKATSPGVPTPVWVISWQIQAMCSGVRGCHCNMYQWIMSPAKRADIDFLSKFCKSVEGINGLVEGWLIVGTCTCMTATQNEDSTHSTRHAPPRS